MNRVEGLQNQDVENSYRRLLLAAGVSSAVLLAIDGLVGPLKLIPRAIESFGRSLGLDNPYKRFLTLIEGKFEIVDYLDVVEIEFIPQAGSTVDWNQGRIVVRREPNSVSPELELLDPSQIKTRRAARVLGSTYVGQSPQGRWGEISVNYKDKEYRGGLWLALTNQRGLPVDPNGNILQNDERPYFVAGNFVTVLPSQK